MHWTDLDTLAGRHGGDGAAVLVEFSRLPLRYPAIAELDLNPVFLLEHGLLVGDVRVIIEEES